MAKTNKLATSILEKKYMQGEEVVPEDVFMRVAKAIAIPDAVDVYHKRFNIDTNINTLDMKKYAEDLFKENSTEFAALVEEESKKYFEIIDNLEFMPASPTLMNAGLNGTLSSCFFIRVKDSMEDIFRAVKDTAIIFKAGGGVGLDFSELRYKGCPVKGTSGNSSGPISFMKVFNTTGETVEQGGRRKAATLGSLRITHPDVVNFVQCKQTEEDLTNFNISIIVPDSFMKDLKKTPDKLHVVSFEDEKFLIGKESGELVPYHPEDNDEEDNEYYTVKDLWDLIAQRNWKNGDPGIIFEDKLNENNTLLDKYGKYGVNPCSELPLYEYEACNLAAINLPTCIENNNINFTKLEKLVKLGVRFLDNVIAMNTYPLDKIREAVLKTRKIGLGVMGLHDSMLKLGIQYGSDESITYIDTVFSRIKEYAEAASEDLGKLRGIPEDLKEIGCNRRNYTLLTCQPTGTVAQIANQVSSGIEPVFKWSYPRSDSYGKHDIRHWILDDFEEDSLPDYCVTAHEIDMYDHIRVQAAIQKYIDASISKTCNVPENTKSSDIGKLIFYAWESGCKSITVYRAGSRQKEVLISKELRSEDVHDEQMPWERPQVLFGATIKINTPAGNIYVTINEHNENIREAFINASKTGSDVATHTAAEGRLISNSLQYNVPVDSIIKHLKGQRSSPVWDRGQLIQSLPDGVARSLELYKDNIQGFSEFLPDSFDIGEHEKSESNGEYSGEICPECGNMLVYEGGCNACKLCGYSACG